MSKVELREKGVLVEIEMETGIKLSDADAIAILARKSEGNIFVEIGSWQGCSALIIARVARELGGHLYCVDHWKGSEGTELMKEAIDQDIYQIFENNLRKASVWDYIIPMKMDSLAASKEFPSNSVDFLFIDGDHRYKQFMEDLVVWMPKVKVGGIICGHDCEEYYLAAPLDLKERWHHNLDIDFDGNYHPGIIKGLYDYFQKDYHLAQVGGEKTTVWFKEIVDEQS